MLKTSGVHTRLGRNLVIVTILLLLTVGSVAVGTILPVEAAAPAHGHHATPMPGSMMESGMVGSGMSMAAMGAMMDQMMAQMHSMMGTMPISGTMPMCAMMHAANLMPMTGTMPIMGMTGMMPMMATMSVSGTMPTSGTMPMANMGMMMQMMGMMQIHMGCTHMMMGAMVSDSMMDEGMMGSGMMGNRSAIEMPSDVPFDAAFIDSMIKHHQSAIDMAEMALEAAENEEVQTLAAKIIATQAAEIEQLHAWRNEWYPDLDSSAGIPRGVDNMISDDESVPFDQRFLEAMTPHHQGAIDMAVMALDEAEHEELRTLAAEIIVAQSAEIHHMQEWWTEWYDTAD